MFVLIIVAFVAGFLDTLAGGGGLLVIPALLLAQVPPVQAIATNKLQGSFGTLTSALTMVSRRQVTIQGIKKPFIAALGGAVPGAIAIQYIPAVLVDIVTLVVLLAIALYFLFSGNPGNRAKQSTAPQQTDSAVITHNTFSYAVAPGIGFYDGAFGPGAGSFYALGGVALRGKNLVQATADAKVLNFASNLAALVTFILSGKVLWLTGGVMILGAAAGAYLGSLAVLNIGARLIRPTIVVMSLAMLCVYIWQRYPWT